VPSDVSAATVAAARDVLRRRDVVLEPRKRWPSGTGRSGVIRAGGPGRALAFGDDPAWAGVLPDPYGPDGPYEREVLDGMVEVLRRFKHHWAARPVAVAGVPSRRHPQRVASVVEAVAAAGRLPVLDLFELRGPGPDGDVASGAKVRSLGAMLGLRDPAAVPSGPVLLVDDTWRSGWTMTVAGALVREAGATAVIPLVVHQLP
jgi:ATP-dependent DNA helicase RecQ